MGRKVDQYLEVFRSGAPLLDVRAPVEFSRGSFPGAVNLPLLSDEQREMIGITFKNEGQQAAVDLGYQLISGDLKLRRIHAWAEFCREHPDGYLYCFRGGMRSKIVQEWLLELGIDYPRIAGGSKAMRQFLIDQLDALGSQRIMRIGGCTGIGKTEVLLALPSHIDLEGIANHRGSAFGGKLADQPSQINFENIIAVTWLKMNQPEQVIFEDESRGIGQCFLPDHFYQAFCRTDLVILEAPYEERLRRIQHDYIESNLGLFINEDPENGFDTFAEWLDASLSRISNRLGGERTRAIRALMTDALALHLNQNAAAAHQRWIDVLLSSYYDPMYDYQLSKKEERVRFRGNAEEVTAFLEDWLQSR